MGAVSMRQNRMPLVLLGAFCALVSTAACVLILVHAFGRSVGTGVMVLCIPCYMAYYAFSQFEHRWKNAIVACWLAGLLLSATFASLGLHLTAPQFPARM
jgi:hypothetical protein